MLIIVEILWQLIALVVLIVHLAEVVLMADVLTQAAIVSRKKKAAVEQLQQVREELSRTEAECEEKRGSLQQAGAGDEVLKGDEVFITHLSILHSEPCYPVSHNAMRRSCHNHCVV